MGNEDGDEELWVSGSLVCRPSSDPIPAHESHSPRTKRKQKRKKRKLAAFSSVPESPPSDHRNGHVPNGVELDCRSYSAGLSQTVVLEAAAAECHSNNLYGFRELRQRAVANNGAEEPVVVSTGAAQSRQEDKDVGFEALGKQNNSETPIGGTRGKLQIAESLDWKRLMSEDPNCESMNWFLSPEVAYAVLSYFLVVLLIFVVESYSSDRRKGMLDQR